MIPYYLNYCYNIVTIIFDLRNFMYYKNYKYNNVIVYIHVSRSGNVVK